MVMRMQSNKCCICKEEHLDEAYNAEPVMEGKCCKSCYYGVVVYQKFNLAGLTADKDYMYNVTYKIYGDEEDE